MKLVVGLGNPGLEYQGSPHNMGFAVVERLAARHRLTLSERRAHSRCGRYILSGEAVWLIQPQTFMNLSGTAVKQWLQLESATSADLLVIGDELDLPWGQIRIRQQGGSGGHHGLDSVIAEIGTSRFVRIRVGVGDGHGADQARRRDPVDYLLKPVGPARRDDYEQAVDTAADAAETILSAGAARAMNRFNQRPVKETSKAQEKSKATPEQAPGTGQEPSSPPATEDGTSNQDE